jgi:CIC family chloride channel protein
MLIGGALGSTVGGILGVSNRERRILLIAGVAAGIAAVFRTPLGAALLAVEILYRDGFESDALIPSVLASVVSYSVVIALFGESTLFAHAPRFPLVIGHLWLYLLLALLVALMAAVFLRVFRDIRHLFHKLPGPHWLRPAVGGLLLGLLCVPIIAFVGSRIHQSGQGLGILGGGYGAVQMAISGTQFLSPGWNSVALLLLLSFVKLLASSLTIGSGGSAGDFAPSLAVGGLLGGAFGRAAQLLLHDPRLDAGAFALVGMGAFYGGIAHTPLAALVLVCEMAGNYDLLVPLMLAQGIAYVALRKQSLYEAQLPTQRDSPVHREALMLDLLKGLHVGEVASIGRQYVSLAAATRGDAMLHLVRETSWQDVFPVLDAEGTMIGLVSAQTMHMVAVEQRDTDWIVAADIMQAPVSVLATDTLRTATQRMIQSGLRELPVVNEKQQIIGFLDETAITQAYLGATGRGNAESGSPSRSEN